MCISRVYRLVRRLQLIPQPRRRQIRKYGGGCWERRDENFGAVKRTQFKAESHGSSRLAIPLFLLPCKRPDVPFLICDLGPTCEETRRELVITRWVGSGVSQSAKGSKSRSRFGRFDGSQQDHVASVSCILLRSLLLSVRG